MDVAALSEAVETDWFFATGCRVAETTNLKAEVPMFPFELYGPRRQGFAATVVFIGKRAEKLVAHQEAWSRMSRSCWVTCGERAVCQGLHIPPRGKTASEAERVRILRAAFAEWGNVKAETTRFCDGEA